MGRRGRKRQLDEHRHAGELQRAAGSVRDGVTDGELEAPLPNGHVCRIGDGRHRPLVMAAFGIHAVEQVAEPVVAVVCSVEQVVIDDVGGEHLDKPFDVAGVERGGEAVSDGRGPGRDHSCRGGHEPYSRP